MTKENMNCSGQKANSKDYDDNYNRIFKGYKEQDDKEMRYCRWCNHKCGEMTETMWKVEWEYICDDCASKIDKFSMEDLLGGE